MWTRVMEVTAELARERSAAIRYGVALALTAGALGLTHAIGPWAAGTLLPPAMAAVVASALVGGFGPGMLSVILGGAALKYWFLPQEALLAWSASSAVRLGMFFALSTPLAVLMASLRASCDRLRRAVKAREDVLAVVSHDLRNPLGAVLTTARLMARDASAGAGPTAARIERIARAAERMDRLIGDLLDHANIEAGKLAVERQPWPLAEILDEAFEMTEPIAAGHGIALGRAAPTRAVVSCDRQRILQVLGNLLTNAIKFTPMGGAVQLLVDEGVSLRIGVADSGPGVPPELRGRIFDRYWKGRPGDTRGAGLGLAIVQGIVAQHGGRVWVEPTPQGGSTFWFTLARAAAREAAAPSVHAVGRDRAELASRG